MFSHKMEKHEIHDLAIGEFDGIHRAHKELFKQLGSRGGILIIDQNRAVITPKERRDEFVSHQFFYYNFDQIRALNGEDFISLLKKDFPNLQKLVVGYDFRFGQNRLFGVEELDTLFSGKVVIVPEFCFDGISVHTRKIKDLLTAGEIFQANRLLGREYALKGFAQKGQGLGKKSLFPTINLKVKDYFIPANGVYAGRTKIGDKIYDAVIFIGVRVSTDGQFALETHILNTDIDVEENDEIELFFVEFLRENRKFAHLEDLKAQINEDIKQASEALKICKIYPEKLTQKSDTDER